MRVLLVEDDSALAELIESVLQVESMNAYCTDRGEEAIDLAKLYEYEIILLDLNLPDMSGYEVLQAVRTEKVETPILVLSGIADTKDKVKILDLGADDYLTKPFHMAELVARIRAITRRMRGYSSSVLVSGEVTLDLARHAVTVKGKNIHFPRKEFELLRLFMLRAGDVVSYQTMLDQIYNGRDEPGPNTINKLVSLVRTRLESGEAVGYIQAIRGVGYKFQVPQ